MHVKSIPADFLKAIPDYGTKNTFKDVVTVYKGLGKNENPFTFLFHSSQRKIFLVDKIFHIP